jgi:hypothetical protein
LPSKDFVVTSVIKGQLTEAGVASNIFGYFVVSVVFLFSFIDEECNFASSLTESEKRYALSDPKNRSCTEKYNW